MSGKVVAEQMFRVGETTLIEGASPMPPFAVVFEDDSATGYFYALDLSQEAQPILDALQIYNVANVSDKHLPSIVQIVWSQNDKVAALLINNFVHAVFDFVARRGYCRSGFPPPAPDSWTQHGHEWDDKALDSFK